MKLIFLDFDGVLNSEASFRMEIRKKKIDKLDTIINQTLSPIATANFQMILDAVPDAKVVISSAWRLFYDLEWLKDKLFSYYVDGSKVIGKTDPSMSGHRGREIGDYLEEVRRTLPEGETLTFVVLDDTVQDLHCFDDNLVTCTWKDGLLLEGVERAIEILGGRVPNEQDMIKENDDLDRAAQIRRDSTNPPTGV